MSFLLKKLTPVSKILALFAKFSAKHPIHVIFTTLLLAAITYLSVIQHYVINWKLDSRSISGLNHFNAQHIINSCTHYYTDSHTNGWKNYKLNSSEFSMNGKNHYYLFTLNFDHLDAYSPVKNLSNVIHENSDYKYILQEDNQLSPEYVSHSSSNSSDDVVWRLTNKQNHLFEVQYLFWSIYNNLMTRFSESEPFDILIILVAYLMVLQTVYSLFVEMSKTGSKFWLSLATICNSGCAFFFSLFTFQLFLKNNVSATSLVEGLPFIIVIVGFKHKIRLAERSTKLFQKVGLSKKTTIDEIIYESMSIEGTKLVHDHLLCIIAFVGCSLYARDLQVLSYFCAFCALMLIYELVLTSTFYSAVLSLKLEMNIIYRSTIIKQALEEDGVVPTTADLIYGQENESKHSLFGSHSSYIINGIKFSVVALFILINLYNFGVRWASETVSLLYRDDMVLNDLPDFIKTNKSLSLNEPIIVSVAPIQYYQTRNTYHKIEDQIMLVLHYISKVISDRFVSKVIFAAFIVSCSVNIYLLNATRIHTLYTAVEFSKRKALNQDTKNTKSATSKSSKTGKGKSGSKNKSGLSKIIASAATVIEAKAPLTTSSSSSLSSSVSTTATSSDYETDTDDLTVNVRPIDVLEGIMKEGNVSTLRNKEVTLLVVSGKLPLYALEKQLGDTTRAVVVRRKALSVLANAPVLSSDRLPYKHYDYDRVFGACCENVIGYMPLPVGVIGPMIIDNVPYHIPMATTEGCLVASAMRGCKAVNAGGGITTVITKDGMTRGPCVRFPSLSRAGACKIWLDSTEGQNKIKKVFNSTSRFARLQHIQTAMAGDLLFIRFRTTTGDAMGMNMISKGVEYSLKQMTEEFGWEDMEIVSVSGNYCTDKKPAAINWIEGRGKSIVAEATIPGDVVRNVLKSDVKALVELNISKNLIGSAMAGSVGGFNAHAANLVTAVYLAVGQDPAQNVESSNCMTLMKEVDGDLKISVSMPSIEVGTIGGGTILEPQSAMLDLLGVRGPHPTEPGTNARQLARIVACAVLAGELSLCAALAAGHLVQSHMAHNRKQPAANTANAAAVTPAVPAIVAHPADEVGEENIERLKEGSKICIKS
ncbi:hypothetical protein TPHA_0B00420 [Tetrapisispora phaffii CBS 4417]|uniref:3-hydroxy-3-methylglutaryl coenzyme A reductase n=1 Tax=Tetrapisispora phaffii (strain ATCC 24235 / CBS 4417 / NBRC 1672 / NRRL Y-8282 / UCD 70-5) TaxID=1071381 RepID=G8BQB6_TETPH|nr:hypothetical protein TPHA_0B00420 [Tetrapisispora phaffii CBS 4417]CCE61713.1 hypothetical protein TPHA_0B00420 [Tetrapisispora phaffii CBS 4417]